MSLIEAYSNKTSYTPEETVTFYISPHSNFDIKIKQAWDDYEVHSSYGTTGNYNTNSEPWENGCGWETGYEWRIPTGTTSGPYIAEFTESATNAATGLNKVLFFVKSSNPGVTFKILFASAVNTGQAYNNWPGIPLGGKSLYDYNSSNGQRSYKVSFNRPTPLDTFGFELPFIKWLFDNNYTVDFCTNVDIHADPTILNPYKLFLSVGHDEYWSSEMRDNIDNFIGGLFAGNLAFFSGNVCWWRIKYYAQNGDNRQIECVKDSNIDPDTINWIYTTRPETLMTGVSFYFGAYYPGSRPAVPYMVSLNKHWLLKDTNPFRRGIHSGFITAQRNPLWVMKQTAQFILTATKSFLIPQGKNRLRRIL